MNDRWDRCSTTGSRRARAAVLDWPRWWSVERPVVVDLGCGDGRLTAGLHEMLGASTPRDRQLRRHDRRRAAQPARAFEFALGDSLPGRSPHPSMWPSPTRRCNGCPTTRRARPLVRVAATRRPTGRPGAGQRRPSRHTVAAELAAELLASRPQTRWRELLALRTTRSCSTSSGSATSTSGSRSTSTTSARHERWSSGEGHHPHRFKEPFGQEGWTGS